MKTFLIGLLFGIIISLGVVWFFTSGRQLPEIKKAEKQATARVDQARESVKQAAERTREALMGKLEVLELKSEQVQKELSEKGKIVRRKARDLGEIVADAAMDASLTATIKAKLAADPDLSALSISVSTAAGRVTLSGTVGSPELIGKAVALALETEGVREVVSTLKVK